MALSQFARKTVCWLLAVAAPALVHGQASFAPDGGEFGIAGTLSGDQVYPHLSVKTTGGYLVWQDNITDGSGLGISARRLDSSLSGSLSPFRVNQNGTNDQERAQVSMLNDGGAAFVWQGGVQGFQRIYARCLTAGGTWATANDVPVSTFTNSQMDAAVTTLATECRRCLGQCDQQFSRCVRAAAFVRGPATGERTPGEPIHGFQSALARRHRAQ